MVKVVIIDKQGNVKASTVNKFNLDTLYKKCKFRDSDNFQNRHTWKWDDKHVSLFAKISGRANTENKYDFPSPMDNELFFGSTLLCAHTEKDLSNNDVIDFTKEDWVELYEKLMGGFENIGDEDSERSADEDDEDFDPDNMTESGYLKNSFVADDNEEIQNENDDESEKEFSGNSGDETESCDMSDDEGNNSELSEESYEYE